METETLKQIIAFELESNCPDNVDIERCADEIAEKLGDDFAPRFYRVRTVVLDGLQALESCLVEAEMEQLAGEIAEKLCAGSEDEEDDFLIEIEDEEGDE
jgi:hypothetical protein